MHLISRASLHHCRRETCRVTIKESSRCHAEWMQLIEKTNKNKKNVVKEYYFSFVRACRVRRVKLSDFKQAIAKIRAEKEPKYFVNLLKRYRLHMRSTDEGRGKVVDFLIQNKYVTPLPVQDLTSEIDTEDATQPPEPASKAASKADSKADSKTDSKAASAPVPREELGAEHPSRKRARIQAPETYRQDASKQLVPGIGYLRHILMPYCEMLINRGLIVKGVRLQDLLTPAVGIVHHACMM